MISLIYTKNRIQINDLLVNEFLSAISGVGTVTPARCHICHTTELPSSSYSAKAKLIVTPAAIASDTDSDRSDIWFLFLHHGLYSIGSSSSPAHHMHPLVSLLNIDQAQYISPLPQMQRCQQGIGHRLFYRFQPRTRDLVCNKPSNRKALSLRRYGSIITLGIISHPFMVSASNSEVNAPSTPFLPAVLSRHCHLHHHNS